MSKNAIRRYSSIVVDGKDRAGTARVKRKQSGRGRGQRKLTSGKNLTGGRLEGQEVRRTGEVLSVAIGDGYLGRVVDPLGNPIDGLGEVATTGTGGTSGVGYLQSMLDTVLFPELWSIRTAL